MLPNIGDTILIVDFNGINDWPIYRETTVIWIEGSDIHFDHPVLDIMGDECNIVKKQDYQLGWFLSTDQVPKMDDLIEKLLNA